MTVRLRRELPPSAFSALILCAGRSSRLGVFKPLLLLDGETLIEWTIRLFRGAGLVISRALRTAGGSYPAV